MVDGHNNDHDDSGDCDELQHGRSWWDKLPAELHAMILFRASDLHSFLARRPRNPNADTIHRIWAYACASNWPGDLFLLPNWSPISDRNGSTNAEPDADINRALVLVTARSFYARLCERFPQWTKSAFVTRRADGADDGRFTRAISTMPRLVHIPLRQAWTDLLDMRDPVALGRLALAHGHGKMLRYLALETGAIDVRGYEQQDAGGQSLLDEALGRGFVDVADVLVEAGLQGWAISPTKLAAAGQLASLQWMHSKRGLQCDRWPTDVLDTAARSGRLDMVKWLHRHRSDGCTTDAVDGALEMHHYQVATWLLAHRPEGCSPAWVCKMASQGRLDILQAMHTNPGVTFTVGVMDEAIRRNQLAVAEWLRANRSEGYSAKPVELALWHSSFDVARWLLSTCGEGCDDSAVNGVAARGRLDVIQTMHETGRVRFTAAVMDTAAANGHLPVVQWLHESRSEGCTVSAVDNALKGRHLDTAIYLLTHRTEGCSDAWVNKTAGRGHLSVIQAMQTNPAVTFTTKAMDTAASHGHLDIVQWLHTHGTAGCTMSAINNALANNHREVVRFLLASRTEGCSPWCVADMATRGRLDILQAMHANPAVPFTPAVVDAAASAGHVRVVDWLLAHRTEMFTWRALQSARTEHIAKILLESLSDEQRLEMLSDAQSCAQSGLAIKRLTKKK